MRWRPFLINPDMPDTGMDRRAYLEEKFGHESRATRVFEALRHAGKHVGIPFSFERVTRIPATTDSHRLIRLAARGNRQAELIEALFVAYFLEGADIGAREVLCRLGAYAGLDPEGVEAYLDSRAGLPAVFRTSASMHRLGIHGVPCFVFNGTYAVAGAQDTEILLRLFDLAVQQDVVSSRASGNGVSALPFPKYVMG
ncbi:MAG: DSBA oxidoreductase [Rhodospirillaceae bacterium]|nr:MAG: DSBA oxidoreductase [Rhodospirillaceae bacterium]